MKKEMFPFAIIKADGELIASFSPGEDEEIVLAEGYDILTEENPTFEEKMVRKVYVK